MQRLGSSAPELKRISPVTRKQDERPLTEQKVEDSWSTAAEPATRADKTLTLFWVSTVAAAAIGALIYLSVRQSPPAPSLPAAIAPDGSSLLSGEREALALSVARSFFDADTADEKLGYILDREHLEAPLREYYSRPGLVPVELHKVEQSLFLEINGHPWFTLRFLDQNYLNGAIGLKETADGFLIDWESFVAYGEMPWDKLCRERPAAPTQIRAKLAQSPYYNYKYADAKQYAAFRIEFRGSSQWLYGYVKRDSPAHKKLLNIIPAGAQQPINIRLHFEADAGADNLVVIDEVLHPLWISPTLLDIE